MTAASQPVAAGCCATLRAYFIGLRGLSLMHTPPSYYRLEFCVKRGWVGTCCIAEARRNSVKVVGRHRPKAVIRPTFHYYGDKAAEQQHEPTHPRSRTCPKAKFNKQ